MPWRLQVATLTRHLQDTNEDLLQTQKVVEALEVEVATSTRPRLSTSKWTQAFRTFKPENAAPAIATGEGYHKYRLSEKKCLFSMQYLFFEHLTEEKRNFTTNAASAAAEEEIFSDQSTEAQSLPAHPRRISSAKTLAYTPSRAQSRKTSLAVVPEENTQGPPTKAASKDREQAWSIGKLSKTPSFAASKPKGSTYR